MKRFKKIKELVKAKPYGLTISLTDCTEITKGYAVAMKETQNSFGDEGLKRVIEVAERTTNVIGWWLDTRTNIFYYDCIMIVEDLQEALRLKVENEQIAIYDITNKKEIF